MTDPVTPAAPASPDTPPAPTIDPTPTPPAAPAAAAPPPAAEPPTPAVGGWGDNWRQTYAGEDEKALKRLDRYASPRAVIDALFEAQKKISAGEVGRPLPANATPEQVDAWRAENGIPKDPAGYLEKLPDGLTLGDEDKAIFGEVAAELHSLNAPPAVMHKLVGWYQGFVDKQQQTFAERESASFDAVDAAMRDEWGGDYRTNVNLVKSFLAQAPTGVAERLQTGRMPDGTPVLNDPATMRWLAQTAREINPVATLVPNSSNPGQGLEDEIKSIENVMRTDRSRYNKDTQMQNRLRDLYSARERMAKAS